MSARIGVSMIVALFALATAAAHMARQQPAPYRTDDAGDPLPPGVIARLGSTRLYQDSVQFLAFSPDDKILASAGMWNTCVLWDVKTGKELRHFELPLPPRPFSSARISSLAFSADNKLIAVGGSGNVGDKHNVVHVWETATGNELHAFGGLPCPIDELAFDPHGRYLAGGSNSGLLQVWDLEKNQVIGPIGDDKSIRNLALSDDGKRLFVVAWNTKDQTQSIGAYEVSSAKNLWQRKCGPYSDAKLLGGGALLAEVDAKGLAYRLVDPESGTEVCRTEDVGANQPLRLLADAAGRLLTVSGKKTDRTLRVWDCATGKCLQKFKPGGPPLWRGAYPMMASSWR